MSAPEAFNFLFQAQFLFLEVCELQRICGSMFELLLNAIFQLRVTLVKLTDTRFSWHV
ncbi:hypothetical protein X907_2637 [Glycocaulis alkaliphilus]|uniref:Uncharacterized protein n=1 Tax=Glycocaulis alkaliphilus TaxID=1434191 RepID=A0A3T0ECX7_9PROT|nr:hypothetical protein X907_2637 [Glycocaulis alkaliphilus]